jgi:hypothetical protein
MRRICSLAIGVVILLAFVVLPGCSGTKDSDFFTSAATAHKAVEEALTAWKEGNALGPVTGTKPLVRPVDSQWRDGKRLTAFTILREEELDGRHLVVAQLTVEGADPAEVRYKVVGMDPLWVFREGEDESPAGM